MYTYLVTFIYPGESWAMMHGDIVVTTSEPIDSKAAVETLRQAISEQKEVGHVTFVSIQLLGKSEKEN